jgi:5-methylcytosine-specific restriction endonuclease McrA
MSTAEYQRAWRQANRERVNAYQRAWNAANPEKVKAKDRKSYYANVEARREKTRRWREANPDKNAAYQERYKERRAEIERARRQANPGMEAEYKRRRRALMKSSQAGLYGVPLIAAKMAYWGNRCWMCGGPFENVDHVKPVAKGGAHLLANLRPSCADCNSKKRARWFGVAGLSRFRRTT